MLGIDYANVDGNTMPNLTAARAAGLRFAILRATYGTWTDPHFVRDWEMHLAAGIVRGAYLFLRCDDERKTPEAQVDAFVASVRGKLTVRDLPPVLDVEIPGGLERVGWKPEHARAWFMRAWVRMREVFGIPPLVYTSARVISEDLGGVVPFMSSPFWLAKPWPWKLHAQAQLTPPPHGPLLTAGGRGFSELAQWFVYQYQGDALGFPGFNKTTDVNRFRVVGPGAVGPHVSWLRRRLIPGDTADVFDACLTEHVRDVQGAHGLVVDGFVGAATFGPIAWTGGAPV